MTPRTGPTLADRVQAGPRDPNGPPAPAPAPGRSPSGPRHCWVRDPPEAPGTWPGVLLAWSRPASGAWQGRAVYVVSGAHGLVLVEAWLDAAHLREA